ncbi:unnamed protein product [Linum tenue]|uniref:Uncharacterized protein n=1 Tax=Linum tenue TaxID=586396 RepID=A0AAV0KRY9_9ROSI|nr:unnamed protein product [Linum tenue]
MTFQPIVLLGTTRRTGDRDDDDKWKTEIDVDENHNNRDQRYDQNGKRTRFPTAAIRGGVPVPRGTSTTVKRGGTWDQRR